MKIKHLFMAVILTAPALSCAGDVALMEPPAINQSNSETAETGAEAQEKAIDDIARALAMTLKAQEHQQALARAIQASAYPERKLEMATAIAAEAELLADINMGLGKQLSETVGPLRTMEMYFPVTSHRESWQPGHALLVGWQLEEWTAPTAYNLDGESVQLSADHPPETPVLMLVPAEVDFSRASHSTSPSSSVHLTRAESTPGWCDDTPVGGGEDVYFKCVELLHLGEHWTRGVPEIEVHAGVLEDPSDPNNSLAKSGRCVSQHNSSYNQNDNRWTGDGLKFLDREWWLSRNLSGEPERDVAVPMFWEDDDTPCELRTQFSWDKWAFDTGAMINLIGCALGQPGTMCLSAFFEWLAFPGLVWQLSKLGDEDDFLGYVAHHTASSNQDFPWAVIDAGGNYNGQVLCDCPIGVDIQGPTFLAADGTFTWLTHVTYGKVGDTFLWEYSTDGANWSAVGSSHSYSRPVSVQDEDFHLRVTVTSTFDAATDSQFVDVIEPLSVSISGPELIPPGATCMWSGMVSDGVAPYTYDWRYGGAFSVGNGSSYTGSKDPGTIGDSFTLELVVHDSDGRPGWAEIIVTESEMAWPCPS